MAGSDWRKGCSAFCRLLRLEMRAYSTYVRCGVGLVALSLVGDGFPSSPSPPTENARTLMVATHTVEKKCGEKFCDYLTVVARKALRHLSAVSSSE